MSPVAAILLGLVLFALVTVVTSIYNEKVLALKTAYGDGTGDDAGMHTVKALGYVVLWGVLLVLRVCAIAAVFTGLHTAVAAVYTVKSVIIIGTSTSLLSGAVAMLVKTLKAKK